jgi:hypothetical protein
MQKPALISLPPLDDSALDALVDKSGTLNALPVDPDYRAAVKEQLKATANAARLVLEFPLDDEAEPGPVFRA